jgi:hypothetical protein
MLQQQPHVSKAQLNYHYENDDMTIHQSQQSPPDTVTVVPVLTVLPQPIPPDRDEMMKQEHSFLSTPPPSPPPPPPPPLPTTDNKDGSLYRYGVFIVSCLYIFFYIGAFFGWGQMQLLLESNRHFSSLCPNNTTEYANARSWDATDSTDTTDMNNNDDSNDANNAAVCTEQTNALIRVQLIAQTVQIMSPLFGYIVDRYGGKCGYYILTIHVWCGLTLLVIITALSNPTKGLNLRIDRLLYVVFILLSTAVSFGGISMIQTGMIFFHHPRTQQRVISTLNALFDAGAITYLLLYQLYDSFHLSIVTIFSTYLGLSIVLLSAGIYFWNVAVPPPPPQTLLLKNHTEDINTVLDHSKSSHPATTITPSDTLDIDNSQRQQEIPNEISANDATEPAPLNLHHQDNNNSNNNITTPDQQRPESTSTTYILIANRTRKQQLVSLPHWCLIAFVGIHATSNQWTLATIRDFLASLGDNDYDNRYLTIFTLLTPVSLLGLPMVDYVIHTYGYYGSLQCVNMLGFGYMLVRLCSTNLNVQIIGFVIFAIFRCFLYSTFQSLVPVLFSTDLVGFVTGILIGVPGITAFLNIPLANYTIKVADGNFFVANLIYTLLIIPCILATCGIGRTLHKEKLFK